jgi:hypothetical protein
MVILRAKCIVTGTYVLFLLVVFKFVKYCNKFTCKTKCLCYCSNTVDIVSVFLDFVYTVKLLEINLYLLMDMKIMHVSIV